MPISINGAYGNSRSGRYKTDQYTTWEELCKLTKQEKYSFKYSGKVLHIDYIFYSKWFNLNGSIKKKDVSNFVKTVEDYLSNIIIGFDDKYVWSFTTKKVHSNREEVEMVIKEIECQNLTTV